jgi:plasmid replication initiation protein
MSSIITGGSGVPARRASSFSAISSIPRPRAIWARWSIPVFSLATRPDRRILEYRHNGTLVTVTPSVKGRATIHDKDILIFCISQLMAAINAGRQVSRTLHLTAHDL